MSQTAQEVFEQYKTRKSEPILRGIHGTFLFDIEKVGSWFATVDNGALIIEQDKRDADCEIKCDERDFIDIVEGRRNLITASMQGRVQVRGDLALAQKFHGFVSTVVEGKRGAA